MSWKHLWVLKKPDLAQRRSPQATLGASSSFACATAVDHFQPGILGSVIADHSAETFNPLWNMLSTWKCYFYVTRTRMRSVPCSARSDAFGIALG